MHQITLGAVKPHPLNVGYLPLTRRSFCAVGESEKIYYLFAIPGAGW